ncbi:protein 4.1-like isoform X3 [Ostrea edulis]|uniref:protein 4.1-like isoform X3 n=1 Tax=Ostrea edulis TaxID=37623 RepID=UPI0024AF8366|nr:protein 4.1-like isoform X3 [Ostrea edulis]
MTYIEDKDRRESLNQENKSSVVKPTQHRSGKMVLCRVLLLDGNDFETDISRNAEGTELFDEVCKKLNINEKEYFGLTYTGTQDVKYWVNHEKKIAKQVKSGTWVFEFAVKFYPPEPSHLSEDITRYQLCLQIRADIYNGKLPCSFMTHAILGSYTVQAEIGDYDSQVDGPDDEYLKAFDFAPQQTPELSQKIHELHKTHKGQTPEEAELNFLENAKKLAMYGVDLHKAKDEKNQVIMLGVCSSGLQLYRDKLRINRFVWPKIIKLTYKRNNFYIKLRQTEGEQELNICFRLDSHKLAKRLWKTCVEHHTFFRLKEPEKNSTGTLIPRFNSRFRYSGRTQKQIREQEDLMDRPKVKVARIGLGNSFRMPRDAEGNIIHPHGEGQSDSYDRTDKLPGHTDTMSSGPPPYSSMDRGDKSHRKPGETEADRPDTTEDQHDEMLGNHDNTEGAPLEAGDSALLEGGVALHGNKKSKEDKEREKREKEEEKQRKKDAEKERKRLEKEKKKNKDTAEDRTDRVGDENATETAINGPSDSMGLYSDAILLGKAGSNAPKSDGSENPPKEGENLDLVKSDKAHDKSKDKKESKKGGGLFGMLKITPSKGKGDKNKPTDTNLGTKDLPADGNSQKGGVGMGWALPGMNELKDRAKPEEPLAPITGASSSSSDEDISHHAILADDTEEQGGFGLGGTHPDYSDKSIDRKMQFIAVTPPSTEVYDRQKGDHTMPFFEPVGSTSDGEGEGTLGKKKPPPVAPKKYRDSQDDKLSDIPPTVATERMRYDPNMDDRPIPTTNVPIVKTQTRTVTYEKDGIPLEIEDGILISSQSHSTRTQTIETTTYKTERDGKTETRVEKKVVISQEENGDDIDHDALLAEAIKSVTEMNPDLSVERIECMRQIEEIDGRY